MPPSQPPLNWGLIGASDIAKTRMIPAIGSRPDSKITAVLSSSAERAKSYAVENSIPRAYHDLDDFLQDAEIDEQLQLFAAIEAGHFPDLDHARFVRPVFQNGVEIQTHDIEMSDHAMSFCQR